MGFSVSGSAAILFIAAFISVGILYSAAYNGYERIQDADDSYDDRILEQRNTAVNITNVTYNESGMEYLSVNATNIGATPLSVSETNLLVDGEFYTRDTYEAWNVDGQTDTGLWLPGETYNITVAVDRRPSRVKLITPPGITETMEVA